MSLSDETKRTLTRQYKESVRPAGVFAVRNQTNGRVYLSSSLNVEGAMNRVRFELDRRTHRNKALQQDWIEHGVANFTFEIVDRVKEREADPAFERAAELENLLALWQEELQSLGELRYNPS
jgi:hypothetical protein